MAPASVAVALTADGQIGRGELRRITRVEGGAHQRRDRVVQDRKAIQLVGQREAGAQPRADRVIRRQHFDCVAHVEAIARIGVLDAVQHAPGVVEAATYQLGVLMPGRPTGDRMVQKHQTHPIGAQLMDHIALVVGGFDQLQRGIGTGEPQPGHVVEDHHVVPGLRGSGAGPLHAGHGIERGEERIGLERVAASHDQSVDGLRTRQRHHVSRARRRTTRP